MPWKEYAQLIPRLCHVCLYSLQGHAYPARCPECGTPEIAIEIRQSGPRAVSWWRICTLGFLPGSGVRHAWTLALLPGYARSAAWRAAGVLGLAVLAILMILFGSWVWSFGQSSADQRWMDRTWWNGGELSATRSAYIDDDVRSGRSRITHRGRDGERVILYFSDGRNHRQEVSVALVGDILRSAPAWLPLTTTHQGLRFVITYIWGPAAVALTVLWLLVLGTDASVGFRRAVVMYLLFSCALIPFLVTIPLVSIAKVGCIAWLWDVEPVTLLAQLSFVTWYLAWFRYIRAGLACPCNRWRKAVFTVGGVLLTLLVLFPLIYWLFGDSGYTWI